MPVETMFSNGPWNGVGTPLGRAATAAEAIREAGLDWSVGLEPVFDVRGHQIPGARALVRTDRMETLSVVGTGFRPIQNSEAFRLGRHSRHDQKYYSTLPNLLGGLIEHTVRRRLMDSPAAVDLQAFLTTLKALIETARSLCREALEKGGLEEHVRRQDARKLTAKPQEPYLRLCEAQNGSDAELPARRASSAS